MQWYCVTSNPVPKITGSQVLDVSEYKLELHGGRSVYKQTDHTKWFDSYAEAAAFAWQKAQDRLTYHQRKVDELCRITAELAVTVGSSSQLH